MAGRLPACVAVDVWHGSRGLMGGVGKLRQAGKWRGVKEEAGR